jgi:hypothetical protein
MVSGGDVGSDCNRIFGLLRWRGSVSPGHDGNRAQGANRCNGLEGQASYRLCPAPVRTGSPSCSSSEQPEVGRLNQLLETKSPPFFQTAQAMRASLLARAVAALLWPRDCSRLSAHARSRSCESSLLA